MNYRYLAGRTHLKRKSHDVILHFTSRLCKLIYDKMEPLHESDTTKIFWINRIEHDLH